MLNNDPTIPAPAVVRAFRINGAKVLLFNTVFNVPPNSATLVVPPLVFPNTTTPVRQWEIQISVGGNQSDVLASVWGLNINGDIIAHHRFAHSELTRIDELT
ncbi:hypothetical protein [Desmospora profundinema]|uniref:Uncharacterized protein n=1 Tax=Desmospora profundinema TaxID=1571184 RepID=A0ABU1IJP2_9BACL|nr:hypothetical protein [Desmospora profundinema]MDR6224978.1 hypothetical protein [Desmospora profundinema]